MTGDKRRSSAPSRPGARGARRDREAMKKAGVTDAGIELVEAVSVLIDELWPSRQAMLDDLGAAAGETEEERKKAKVPDRKQLSRELGSKSKREGPEWRLITMIVTVGVKEPAARERTLARMAGLYCVARQVQAPPSYDKTISWPPGFGPGGGDEGSLALRVALDRMQRELDHKVASLEDLRSLYDGAMTKLAEQQQQLDQNQLHLDLQRRKVHDAQDNLAAVQDQAATGAQEIVELHAQVTALSRRAMLQGAELERVDADRQRQVGQLAAKETEIGRLTQAVMYQSAQTIQMRGDLEGARRVIAVQQRGLADANARLAEQSLLTDAGRQRHTNLRERCARMAARLEYLTETPAPQGSATRDDPGDVFTLTIQPRACDCRRGLSAYLLIHQEYSGHSVSQIAAALHMRHEDLEEMLTAYLLPTPQQLAALVHEIGAEITHARLLYDDAVACPNAGRPPAYGRYPSYQTPGSHGSYGRSGDYRVVSPRQDVDSYESIVGRIESDTATAPSGDTSPSAPFVAASLGDSDTVSPDGETTDSSRRPPFPTPGDTAVAGERDNPLSPIRIIGGDTGLYRSRNHQRRQRRHRWAMRAVTAVGTACIPLLFTLAADQVQPLDVPVVYLSTVATCLTCWAIAITTRKILRRLRYRARHSPGACPPIAATITGAAPASASCDTPPGPGTDMPATTVTLILTPVAAPEVPVEPNLDARAQALAQALRGRQGLGIQRLPEPAAGQGQEPDGQRNLDPA
jgi:hypothetical protein